MDEWNKRVIELATMEALRDAHTPFLLRNGDWRKPGLKESLNQGSRVVAPGRKRFCGAFRHSILRPRLRSSAPSAADAAVPENAGMSRGTGLVWLNVN